MQPAVGGCRLKACENPVLYSRAIQKTHQFFSFLFYFPVPAAPARSHGAAQKSGGRMTFDETLYGRDDEMDEFGDSGAYGDSLEEDYEEEEEEEEAAEVPAIIESQPEPAAPAPSAPRPASSGGGSKPPRKPAAKKAAKKKPARKVVRKKPAKKKKPARKAAAKKKVAKKKPARKAKKAARKGGRRR
jgi:outer membrane biosynthesis protein TonB